VGGPRRGTFTYSDVPGRRSVAVPGEEHMDAVRLPTPSAESPTEDRFAHGNGDLLRLSRDMGAVGAATLVLRRPGW
jgi:hypothetical protein